MILIILLYATCALTFTIAKATLLYALPIFYIAIRMIIAGTLLLGFYRWFFGSFPKINGSDKFLFFQVIFLNIYLAYVLDLWSLQYITSIESSLIFNISPFMAALFSYYYFSETMTLKKWIGLILGVISLMPLLFKNNHDAIAIQAYIILPLLALFISVVSSAYGWIIMRELVKIKNYSPLFVNGIGMLGGGICALITSYFCESWDPSPVFSWPDFIFYTFLMLIVSNFIFSNLYSYLLKHYTATLLSFCGFLCPIFAMLFGYFFLQEALSLRFVISCSGLLIGLILFYQEELQQGYIK